MSEQTEASKQQSLLIEEIRLSDEVQSRAKLNHEAIGEFADAMKEGTQFPPVVVFHDGERHWCADGFHRVYAAIKTGLDRIAAEVREGGEREAILHSVGANRAHGIRRTPEDKHRAVNILLDDPEWAQWSDGKIAQIAAVSQSLVSKIHRERTQHETESPRKRKTVKGHLMDTTNIGASPRKKRADPRPSDAVDGDGPNDGREDQDPRLEQNHGPGDAARPEDRSAETNAAGGADSTAGEHSPDASAKLAEDASPAAQPGSVDARPADEVPLRAFMEGFVQRVDEQAALVQKEVTAGSITAEDARRRLDAIVLPMEEIVSPARTDVLRIVAEARRAIDSTGGNPAPSPKVAKPLEMTASA